MHHKFTFLGGKILKYDENSKTHSPLSTLKSMHVTPMKWNFSLVPKYMIN